MTFLKKLFAPPVFDDAMKTREANLLNFILWGLVIAPLPYVIYTLAKEPDASQRVLAQYIIGESINFFLLWFMRRGQVRTASILHISLFWLFFTVTAFTREGVNGNAYLLGSPLTIFIAGALLGTKAALTITSLALISGGVMVSAQAQGWAGTIPPVTTLSTWLITLAVFPMLTLLQYFTGSELKKALSRAHASEERYRLISQVSSDYTFSTVLDAEGKMYLNWVAGAFEQMTGYTFDEYVASGGWQGHLLQDDLERDKLAFEKLTRNESAISEARTFRKNGEIVWVRVYAHPIWDEKENRLIGIVGAVQNITDRKQAKEALTRERDLLQIFMDNIPDHVYFKDIESRFIRVNKAQANFLKLEDPKDAIGKTDFDFQAPDLARQFHEEEKQIMESGEPVINRVEFNPTEDGRPRWLSATKTPAKDSSGNLLGTIGISRDITEQKQAEAMLAYERDILQIFMDNIPDQVYFKDIESRFVRINQGQARFLGIDNPQDAIGKTDLDFQSLELAQEFMSEEKRVIETGRPVLSRIEFNPTKDGKPRWLSTSKVPAKNEFGHIIGTIGISVDVTEQKLAKEVEETRRKMLERVLELGKRVTEVSDLQTTLKQIWHAVHEDLDFDRLGIFLYNTEDNSVYGAYGTNKQGEIVDESNIHISLDRETDESLSFTRVLSKENGLYFTRNYTEKRNVQKGDIMYGVKDYAAVAMWAGDKPMGIICVDNLITDRPIGNDQLEALRLFAGYAGLAIENSRLNDTIQNELAEKKQAEEVEQRRRQMLEKVVQLGKQVTEVNDLRTTLKKIWHGVRDELDFDRAGLFIYNPQENNMTGAYGTDRNGNIWDAWHVTFELDTQSQFYKVLIQPNGLYFTEDYEKEYNLPPDHEMAGVKHAALVAVWGGNKPIALISVDQLITGRPILEEQLEALRLFASYAGLAISNSHLNDALQDELSQRQTFIDELEAKNAELERFTYTASHDLKSPLVTITGFLSYLEKDALAGDQERVKSNIARINSAAEKMQALLNDLLELSRIGRLMNPPEDIPFIEIVNEAVDRVRGRLDEVNAIVEIQSDLPVVNGDRVRLVEVVQNFIENAVKYAKPGTKPHIEIGSNITNKNESPVFYVCDNGMGIDPQFHERIFGLFNKLDAQSEGTGIGLSLVKRIIEVHGGRVWVESEKGKGATFYFSLPTSQTKE